MSIMTTTFSASASFSLTDASGVTLFSYSPSFTSARNTSAHCLYAGEHLAQTGNSQLECGSDLNVNRIYAFIKNVDTDYAVTVLPDSGQDVEISHLKPGEFVFAPMDLNADNSGTSLRVTAATADQKVQYLIVDAITN